ncbi:putative immunity protein [Frigoribacterium salinisoli]
MIDVADLTLSDAERRQLITWTSACAVRLLPIFDADSPSDSRLRDALAGSELFTAEQLGVGAMRKLAFGCHAAAREARSPEATAVARVVGQAMAVAHMAGHSREIARYTRKALSGSALDVELAWQREHVPPQFAAYVFVDGVQ